MSRAASAIDRLSEEERQQLKLRLWNLQSHNCFLCGKEIVLEADSVEIDHKDPQADHGLDDDSNWALMHEECNNKKRAKNLELARAMIAFDQLKEEHDGAVTAGQVLESKEGSRQDAYLRLLDGKILLRYDNASYEYPIFVDPSNSSYSSFFALLPKRLLFHDSELNPRKVVDINKLMEEFFNRNPQLHVSLCRVHIPDGGGQCKILLFDGQHKTAAQVMLGRNDILCRVFVNPDKDSLKEVNKRAHKELRQIEFFRSVLDTLGQDIFSVKFKEYLENPSTTTKSEKGFIDFIEASQRPEMEKNLQHYLKARVRDSKTPQNRFFDYVELEKSRSREKPVSYDSVEKTFLRWFIDSTPCEVEIDEDGTDVYVRDTEASNLVKLMNLFAEKTLVGKFDVSLGAYKIEEKVRTGTGSIPTDHLRAFRLYRPAVFIFWCELMKDAIADYLVNREQINNDMRKERKKGKGTRILWTPLSEDDWKNIGKMVDRFINHKIWIDRGIRVSEAFNQTRTEFFKKFLENGILGDEKVLDQPINIRYITMAVGD